MDMNDGNAELLFQITFGITFVAAAFWMFAIFSRNIESRVPFVVLPVHVALFSFASWLFFENSFDKVIALPILTLVVVRIFKGVFKRKDELRSPRGIGH